MLWSWADTDAKSRKFLGAQSVDDILHASVSRRLGVVREFNFSPRQIDVIVQDEDIFGGEFVKRKKRENSFS